MTGKKFYIAPTKAIEKFRPDLATSYKFQLLRNQIRKANVSREDFINYHINGAREQEVTYISYRTTVMHNKLTVMHNNLEVGVFEIVESTDKTDINSSKPSKLNPILIRAALPPEVAEDAIANLEHYFESVWQKKHGPKLARIIFYIQTARVILGYFAGGVRSALELYLKFRK